MIVRAESINVPAYRLNVQITITEAKALLAEFDSLAARILPPNLQAFQEAMSKKMTELINQGKVTW